MSENNAVSDNESIGSHPYDLDMNTHSSMFRYDNNTLGFVCRTLPGYTHEERKFGRLSVHALQASWRECRENDRTFEDVPGKFLKIIPPKKLPEFHRLKAPEMRCRIDTLPGQGRRYCANCVMPILRKTGRGWSVFAS